MYENVAFIIRIKYLNNCKVIFENSQLTLVTLKPKIVPKNKLAIFRISSKNCKNKRILIPIKEEIYYEKNTCDYFIIFIHLWYVADESICGQRKLHQDYRSYG